MYKAKYPLKMYPLQNKQTQTREAVNNYAVYDKYTELKRGSKKRVHRLVRALLIEQKTDFGHFRAHARGRGNVQKRFFALNR